jgi:hypothetical protein
MESESRMMGEGEEWDDVWVVGGGLKRLPLGESQRVKRVKGEVQVRAQNQVSYPL